ncbi:MAG: IS66 family transposase [Firmicutes bacterium]|nr:IS66 family transposase [Candidatus Fiminaster equi]
MAQKHTLSELNNCSKEELITIILTMQGQLDTLNENIEKLIEQVRIANQQRFGRHTETMDSIDGQLSFFDEADVTYDESVEEPSVEEILPAKTKKKKSKGKREEDLKDFPEEIVPTHGVSEDELNAFYGVGNWRKMPDEVYKRLRHEPESWTVEVHTVEVYVGIDGDHQDEFMRGKRPHDLLKNSIVTPSLEASIINAKYVNSSTLNRIEEEFKRNNVNITRQTMSNWTIKCAKKYFIHLYQRMQEELLKLPVTQSDETPTNVINDGRKAGAMSYMWVHRSGEFYKDKPIVLYEYQKGRNHELPLEFYRNYKGVLVTDGLNQYHIIERELPDLINANCWAHARRDYADAIKAADKQDAKAVKKSTAYQALKRIGQIFELDGALKDLSPEERLQERQRTIKPLVEEYFAWVKNQIAEGVVPPKSKTASGLNYSVNQEKYLKVFLDNPDVPMDNSASERSIRTFCIGKKNWMFHDSIVGAESSAIIYSISETAKLNNLRPYYYFKHLLTELPKLIDDEGNIETTKLDELLPWAKELLDECRKIAAK